MHVQVSPGSHVATVHAAGEGQFEALQDALAPLTDGYSVRAVVLDFRGVGAGDLPGDDGQRWLERYPVPLVAVLSGPVSESAAARALGCDIRVCEPSFSSRIVPAPTRRSQLLLGEPGIIRLIERRGEVDAALAAEIGLVSAVVVDAMEEAHRIAEVVASRGPIATRFAKEAIWRGLDMPLAQALRVETDLTILLQSTKDRAEGVAAFLQKRQPLFRGE